MTWLILVDAQPTFAPARDRPFGFSGHGPVLAALFCTLASSGLVGRRYPHPMFGTVGHLDIDVVLIDAGSMGAGPIFANAWGIPYDAWWAIWAVLAFVAGPFLVVHVWTRSRRGLLLAVIPVPAVLGIVLLGIASRCNSFGLYSGRSCDGTVAKWQGWIAIVIAMSVFVIVAVVARRPPPQPSE